MTDSGFLEIELDRRRDPDGEKLAAILRAQRECERLATARRGLSALAGILAAPLAALALMPTTRLAGVARTIAGFWVCVGVAIVYTLVAEDVSVRKVNRLLRDIGGRRSDESS